MKMKQHKLAQKRHAKNLKRKGKKYNPAQKFIRLNVPQPDPDQQTVSL